MNEQLQSKLRGTIWAHSTMDHLVDALTKVIEYERRTAAVDMRDRCINVCKEHYPDVLPNNLGYTIGEHMALTICEQIGELSLDSNGGV